MKASGIGGQAVIEGVMMKNKSEYAIAVRKPNNDVVVVKDTYHSIVEHYTFLRLPVIRGVFAFIESMVVGMKTLKFSASFYDEEEENPTKVESAVGKMFREKAEAVIMGLTVLLASLLAVGLFVMLPFLISEILKGKIIATPVRALIEGIIRIGIFILYVAGISRMNDIKRVFMYHGAEHKVINCIENGLELNVQNVKGQSTQHKRCGTSFMLIVMLVSIIFFIFINVDNVWMRMFVRLLLVPVIAGVSYEFIRFSGRSQSSLMEFLSKPGMWLQSLTTREPDDSMIEIAIQAVEAVFDWRAFLNMEEVKKEKQITQPDSFEDFIFDSFMKESEETQEFEVVKEEPTFKGNEFFAGAEFFTSAASVDIVEPVVKEEPKGWEEPPKREDFFSYESSSKTDSFQWSPIIEPAREEPTRVEPVRVSPIIEPARVEPVRVSPIIEPARVEPVRVEPVIEPVRVSPIIEPARVEPVRVSPIIEPARVEPVRVSPIIEPARVEPEKADPFTSTIPTIPYTQSNVKPVSEEEGKSFVRHLAGLDVDDGEEEEDEVLKALDQFFKYGKEK